MIKLSDVSKSFGQKTILKSISIEFENARTHVLLGLSGCGKSTILRLIMGLTWPDEGQVLVEDQIMIPITQRELAQKIGYVIQDGGLFPHLTAFDNVGLVAKIQNWKTDQIQHRISELSELVGLEPQTLAQFPRQLSGGQRQRVGLMRALMLDPDILLLDEPLGALDPIVRMALQEQLKKIFNRLKKTVVLVTHDMGEAAFFGHTVTVLNNGRLIQSGTFEQLLRDPASPFITDFINSQRPPPE